MNANDNHPLELHIIIILPTGYYTITDYYYNEQVQLTFAKRMLYNIK